MLCWWGAGWWDDEENTLLRRYFAIPDSNMFVTSFVLSAIVEVQLTSFVRHVQHISFSHLHTLFMCVCVCVCVSCGAARS
jgi:hypothetical protein